MQFPRPVSEKVHHLQIKVSPEMLRVIEERLADHYCLKIKTFCIIEQGTNTIFLEYLGKTLVARANSNNSIELLKHCNEYGLLFLAPL